MEVIDAHRSSLDRADHEASSNRKKYPLLRRFQGKSEQGILWLMAIAMSFHYNISLLPPDSSCAQFILAHFVTRAQKGQNAEVNVICETNKRD